MDKNNLAFATITWARNSQEEDLLQRALGQLTALGLPVFISDGGSGPDFIKYIERLPNVHLSTVNLKGVWAQARNSVKEAAASGVPFVFYTEPDKLAFFSQFLQSMIETI